ncbi:hypothetical protein BD309DRAFT_130938 [Dichomitus squalens]|uniref:Uncharacterized protein n=2 Tax=Dichomitus squalens TaxID=114155 RepID=A0A4Q9MT89_9APHY|nr:uncharacterized protein DICSQDRAFT_156569 [Dichomitus squalens LYAD-421 SS1]EJF58776.1 hypothetical protein DICSQDRAFT_156569 [Dichomitus squalens LYAD-421 SS1]TBU30855.1 hypothetical protein BD311DRAFT_658091 [Dichomitus squalens]TBU43108.1 hypothetical protein BD309DRAFT_130938 [Dichomitus squalens]TBU53974.1 hypothetical protein BD310DRAFT_829038 [Dichomitus squalens]
MSGPPTQVPPCVPDDIHYPEGHRYTPRTEYHPGDRVIVWTSDRTNSMAKWHHSVVLDREPREENNGMKSYPAALPGPNAIGWFNPEKNEILYDNLLSQKNPRQR